MNEITGQRANAFVLLIVKNDVVANEEALRCKERLRRFPNGSNKGLSRTVNLVNLCHGVAFGGVLDAANTALEPEVNKRNFFLVKPA